MVNMDKKSNGLWSDILFFKKYREIGNKFIFLLSITFTAICLNGCSSMQAPPFQDVALNQQDASRITVLSGTDFYAFNGKFARGFVYLDSKLQGAFSENQPTFTREVNSGTYNLSICIDEDQQKCVRQILKIKPNTHITLSYTASQEYRVIYANNTWTLKVVKVDEYFPRNSPRKDLNQDKPQKVSNRKDFIEMEKAQKKCLDLGFKSNTEEFGKCVLNFAE
jgi:hypothetical protein